MYHAVERGRRIDLVQVSVAHNRPFAVPRELLLEPCEGAEFADREVPCWPGDRSRITQALLERLHDQVPAYRKPFPLLHHAKFLNPDVGARRAAFVIGTQPLVVAFRDHAPDPIEAYKRAAGEPTPENAPVVGRHPKLVTDDDLSHLANVVIRFPDEFTVELDADVYSDPGDRGMTAEVVVMGELRTIADLMGALAGQQPLAASAKTVARVPVNWRQGNESAPPRRERERD